jgi:endonuclease/exonuclease/phosphatase family metal-dependent hydrolase
MTATCLLLTVALLLQPAAPDQPAPPADGQGTLRVMTFNIRYGTADDGENRWERRKGLVVATIAKADPDVLGVQEALASQVDELREALPAYEFVGAGRDDGKRQGEFAGIYFKAERFEKLAAGDFWLSETPGQPGSEGWDASLPRVSTWARLRDRRSGATTLFLNTHFDHRGPRARLESATLLRRKAAELRGDAGAVVVMGDFNATEDDEPYAALVGEAPDAVPLVDSYRAAHPERAADEATFHGFTGKRTGSRIDWVLHSPELRTTLCEIVREPEGRPQASDHFAVLAVLAPSSAPAADRP